MSLFFLLLTTALPLMVLIALGFVAGRKLNLDTMTLANLAIFIMAPVVNFGAMARLKFEASYLLLPFVLFIFAAGLSLLTFYIAQKKFSDGRANIIGMSAGTGNTGYFGIPIILALFGPDVVGVYLLMNLAISLNEITVGYYIAARNHSTMRESLRKVARLPHVYAIAAGLCVNFSGLTLPDIFYSYWEKFVGAWIIIGMMIMGSTLARIPKFTVSLPLLASMLATKFIMWPLAAFGLVLVDRHWLHLFDMQIHTMLMVLALVPMAVNVVAISIRLDLKAGDAAIAVLISTLIAIFYLPLVLLLLGFLG